MVLAETVQIDGGVVALFLLVVGVLFAAWLTLLIAGARVVRRAAEADRGAGLPGPASVVAAIDLVLVVLAVTSRPSSGTWTLVLVLPAVVHAGIWWTARDRG